MPATRNHCRVLRLGVGCLMLALGSCAEPPGTAVYQPLDPALRDIANAPTGSLTGDFAAAARSATLETAGNAWSEFLSRYAPRNGYYEDAIHSRYVLHARFELMRVRYLQGKNTEADVIARQLAASMDEG